MSDLSRPSGPKIIAIANQKGRRGKNHNDENLAAALSREKQRVLKVIDLDPQGNASTGLGYPNSMIEKFTNTNCLLEVSIGPSLSCQRETEGLHIVC